MNKKISLCELAPIIEEKLNAGGSVTFDITGTSMLPLLVQRRDSVRIVRCDGKLKKYDLPLYRRADGSFVLHRVIGVRHGEYVMCGDNQYIKEYPIKHSQIIGVTESMCIGGKSISVLDASYMRYVKRRVRLRILRLIKAHILKMGRVLLGKR